MATIPQVPPIPGVKEALGLLAFIRDADKYGGYLERLVAMRDEVNALVAAYGTVSEIEALRNQAKTDRQMAAEGLAKARAEAEARLAEAQAAHDDAEARVASATAACERREAEASARAATLAAAEQAHAEAIARDQARLASERAEVKGLREAVEALKADYDAKLARLRAAAAAVE